MCGRFQLDVPFSRLVEWYGDFVETNDRPELPALNIGPTHVVPVVHGASASSYMRWGFPAIWRTREGKNPWSGSPLFNTRCETALTKATWKDSLLNRRCLIPCTGFYEWLVRDDRRLPVWFRPTRTEVLSMAGIWRVFDKDGTRISCVSILTIRANSCVAPIHDRMPVFVPIHARRAWLDHRSVPDFRSFFRPAPDGILEPCPVSSRLGRMRAMDRTVLIPDWDLDRSRE